MVNKRTNGKLRCHNTVTRSRSYKQTERDLIVNNDNQIIDYIYIYCVELIGKNIYMIDDKTLYHVGYIHDAMVNFKPSHITNLLEFSNKLNVTVNDLKERIIVFGNTKIRDAVKQCKYGNEPVDLIVSKRSLKKLKFTSQFRK